MLRPANPFDAISGNLFGGYITCSAVAAKYSHIQLKNPTGSNKLIIVRRLAVSVFSAANVYYGFYDTDLVTASGAGINLLRGGAASSAALRSEALSSLSASYFGYGRLAGTDTQAFEFRDVPLVVPAGKGAVVALDTPNIQAVGQFEWIERAA